MNTTRFQILALSMLLGIASVAAQTTGEVTSVVLWDAVESKEYMELTDGMAFCLEPELKRFSILAKTSSDIPGSVYMKLSGPVTAEKTDNAAPFFINGGSLEYAFPIKNDGQLQPLVNGEYTIIAEPYSRDNKGGDKGDPVSITFTVNCDLHKVTSFYLWDAFENKELMELQSGMEFCLNPPLPWFSVEARVAGNVGSVFFELEGPVTAANTDSSFPYFLAGNQLAGDGSIENVFPTRMDEEIKALTDGNYKVTAEPYGASEKGGTPGIPLTVNFRVKCPTLCRRC